MLNARKLLVIDDDRQLVQGLAIRMQAAGYLVLNAYDGQSGIAAAMEHKPDVVLLDLRMPNMGGLEVLMKLSQWPDTARIPVIVVSANVNDQTRKAALDLGAKCCIVKPFRAADVIAAMERAVERPRLLA